MDPSSRATLHRNMYDLDQPQLLIQAGVRIGDVIVIDPTTPDENGGIANRFVFDGDRLLEIEDFPKTFNVPTEFPPRYWSEVFPEIRSIPGTFNLAERHGDVFVTQDDNDEYLIVPFLNVENATEATENNVYYVMDKIDPDNDVDRNEEARGLIESLHENGNNTFHWTDRAIGGIDPDRILIHRH